MTKSTNSTNVYNRILNLLYDVINLIEYLTNSMMSLILYIVCPSTNDDDTGVGDTSDV